MTKNINIKH